MPQTRNLTSELQEVQFASYPQIYEKFKALSNEYGGLPTSSLINAFSSVNGFNPYMTNNPYVQNTRVKQVTSLPRGYTKDKVAEMIATPYGNEQPLREVEHSLEYQAYPMFHTRKVYQDLLTYHNYIAPGIIEKGDAKKDDFWREYRLLEKLRKAFNVKENAHRITGQALQEGKVFYTPRYKVDKSHNKVEYAFMQQLPSDWVKIVGFNNKSKYTIAFDLTYFCQPGTDITQFGDLFTPYIGQFADVVTQSSSSKVVYASKTNIDLKKLDQQRVKGILKGNPDVYYQNGRWYYWVTLPVTKVFTFEVDDANPVVISPFTGLFIDMLQLASLEAIQLELLQNPLVSLVTGEIPYNESKDSTTADNYKLSNAGKLLFESYWYQMLNANNTSGIGLYLAPVQNLKLHSLAEAPSAMEITSNGYSYTMAKAGLSGILPVSDDPRAGVAQISMQIESKFAKTIYNGFKLMFNCIIESLNTKYDWEFTMFGDLSTDDAMLDQCRNDMTLGILPATLIYNALNDKSIFDDMSMSEVVMESGLLDKRVPLVSSFSAKQDDDGQSLPPNIKHEQNPGGRPSSDGEITSEGQETDSDIYGE